MSKYRQNVESEDTKKYFFNPNPLTMDSGCDKILNENKKHRNDRSGLCALYDTSNYRRK